MVGIITLNHDTFTNPTLCGLIKKLNLNGIKAMLFCGYQNQKIPHDLDKTSYFNAPKSINIPRTPINLYNYFKLYYNIIRQVRKNKIRHIIAVDPYGLILIGRLKYLLSGVKIHYISFEIFFSEEMKNATLIELKKKEVYYIKKVHSIIIQDEERKKLLIEENKITPLFTNWFLIPVAPLFDNSNPTKEYHKSDFGLDERDTVYIHAGSITKWAGIENIILTLELGLPKNTYIFIHNRWPFNPAFPIDAKLLEIQAKSGSNLILHDKNFDNYVEYLSFLKIFDYGIALYKSDGQMYTGKNISEIGLASGKFSSYMYAGLPTLVSDCQTFRSLVENYNIGKVITDNDLYFHLKHQTLQNIQKKDCTAFYDEILNPNQSMDNFIHSLNLN